MRIFRRLGERMMPLKNQMRKNRVLPWRTS